MNTTLKLDKKNENHKDEYPLYSTKRKTLNGKYTQSDLWMRLEFNDVEVLFSIGLKN